MSEKDSDNSTVNVGDGAKQGGKLSLVDCIKFFNGISCFGTGVYVLTESIMKGSFGFGEIMGIILGFQLCIASLVVCIQTYYIMKASELCDIINNLHDEVVRTSALVDTLRIHKEYLESETCELQDFKMALKDFMTEQKLSEEEFERLLRQSRDVNMKAKKVTERLRLEEVISVILESSDEDFKVQGSEMERMIMNLQEYNLQLDIPNFDLDVITNSIIDNDGDIKMAVAIVRGFMPHDVLHDYDLVQDKIDGSKAILGDSSTGEGSSASSIQLTSRNPQFYHCVSLLGKSKKSTTLSAIDFLQDNPVDMTLGRRIALTLMKFKFYYPSSGQTNKSLLDSSLITRFEDNPAASNITKDSDTVQSERPTRTSLEKAWAFFEHNTLPRYKVKPKPDDWKRPNFLRRIKNKVSKADKQLDIADPSERFHKTQLYSPIFTPIKQMGDFGVGIGLYFSTLRFFSMLTFLAGLINLPTINYFTSDEYSDGQPTLPNWLKGSAICTRTKWVRCVGCDFFGEENHRLTSPRLAQGIGTNILTGEQKTVYLALKNDCPQPDASVGSVYVLTICFLILGILVMDIFQKNMEVKFDEDEQTASDYSINILNPPKDARDPQEWKDFFENVYINRDVDVHVTCCTVGIDNQQLLLSLLRRRELRQRIRFNLPYGSKMDNHSLKHTASEIKNKRNLFQRQWAKIFPSVPEWFDRIELLESSIVKMAENKYNVTTVFVTFETEAAQRDVLASLANMEYKFRDSIDLKVKEAAEPSSLRWQFMDVQYWDQVRKIILTTFATLAGLVAAAVLGIMLKRGKVAITPYVIAVCNQGFPIFALFLTKFEKHSSRDSLEISLYVKIVIFRWTNTAIVTAIASDFTETLDPDGLIPGVFNIFVAEILITNIIQLIDLYGNIKRHIFAPRARTEEQMFSYMTGGRYYIAERYTNVTKILFLALWYSTIYPATYFMSTIAFTINYFSDRFSLMRSWNQIGKIGSNISLLSRRGFCVLAIFGLALHGTYLWASFPFDNLCLIDQNKTSDFDGILSVSNIVTKQDFSSRGNKLNSKDYFKTANGEPEILQYGIAEGIYKPCDQDMIRYRGSFPPLPHLQKDEWMTKDQEAITLVLSICCLLLIVFVCGNYGLTCFRQFYASERTCTFIGEDQNIDYSDEDQNKGAYIPQVYSDQIQYPLIACDSSTYMHDLFEWNDPQRSYEYYDLTRDFRSVLKGKQKTADIKSVFSRVLHDPPPETTVERSVFE